jgi:hypothetical protein
MKKLFCLLLFVPMLATANPYIGNWVGYRENLTSNKRHAFTARVENGKISFKIYSIAWQPVFGLDRNMLFAPSGPVSMTSGYFNFTSDGIKYWGSLNPNGTLNAGWQGATAHGWIVLRRENITQQ